MAFGLQDDYVVLDGNDFATQKEVNTERHYFEERVPVRGIFYYPNVAKGEELVVSLASNNISTPVMIDSIMVAAEDGSSDAVDLTVYKEENGTSEAVTKISLSNEQLPFDFPDAVIFPDQALGVSPRKKDATVIVYVKPVKVAFIANHTPVNV